jgi:hypothetical protein
MWRAPQDVARAFGGVASRVVRAFGPADQWIWSEEMPKAATS